MSTKKFPRIDSYTIQQTATVVGMVALVAAVVFTFVYFGQPERVRGAVTDKSFTAGSCDVVILPGQNGGVTPGMICSSDAYALLVRTEDGQTHRMDVDEVEYNSTHVGEIFDNTGA